MDLNTGGLYLGEGFIYMEPILCVEFLTPVIYISRKGNGTRQKKAMLLQ